MNGKSLAIRTDWSKVDAHVIQPEEYEELPEWTDDMFETADVRVGGQLVHPQVGPSLDEPQSRRVTGQMPVKSRSTAAMIS